MLLIIGSFRIDPARLGEARPAMDAMIAATRGEPGCIQYAYAEDVAEPGRIHVIERWTDRGALESHFSAPHLLEWRASWGRLGIGERDLKLYDGGEPEPI
jgi:quinol monooxygenase YgiN